MKYVIKHEVGSVYWLENGNLMFAPLSKDGSFDTEYGGEVDHDIMDDEPIEEAKTFGELYAEVEEVLKK